MLIYSRAYAYLTSMVLKDTLATLRGIYEKWQYKIVHYFSDIFDQK